MRIALSAVPVLLLGHRSLAVSATFPAAWLREVCVATARFRRRSLGVEVPPR